MSGLEGMGGGVRGGVRGIGWGGNGWRAFLCGFLDGGFDVRGVVLGIKGE